MSKLKISKSEIQNKVEQAQCLIGQEVVKLGRALLECRQTQAAREEIGRQLYLFGVRLEMLEDNIRDDETVVE